VGEGCAGVVDVEVGDPVEDVAAPPVAVVDVPVLPEDREVPEAPGVPEVPGEQAATTAAIAVATATNARCRRFGTI